VCCGYVLDGLNECVFCCELPVQIVSDAAMWLREVLLAQNEKQHT
jgi:hypothetical protein